MTQENAFILFNNIPFLSSSHVTRKKQWKKKEKKTCNSSSFIDNRLELNRNKVENEKKIDIPFKDIQVSFWKGLKIFTFGVEKI